MVHKYTFPEHLAASSTLKVRRESSSENKTEKQLSTLHYRNH